MHCNFYSTLAVISCSVSREGDVKNTGIVWYVFNSDSHLSGTITCLCCVAHTWFASYVSCYKDYVPVTYTVIFLDSAIVRSVVYCIMLMQDLASCDCLVIFELGCHDLIFFRVILELECHDLFIFYSLVMHQTFSLPLLRNPAVEVFRAWMLFSSWQMVCCLLWAFPNVIFKSQSVVDFGLFN